MLTLRRLALFSKANRFIRNKNAIEHKDRATMTPSILTVVLMTLLITAIYTDLRWSLIPNWLTFSGMGFGLLVQAWIGGLHGALYGLAGLSVGLGLFLLPYACRAISAGDVKLMAAIGSIVGPFGTIPVAVLSVMAGGIYALGAMSYEWGIAATSRKLAAASYGAFVTGGATGTRDLQLPFKLRYGLAIAAGTLLFVLGVHSFGG